MHKLGSRGINLILMNVLALSFALLAGCASGPRSTFQTINGFEPKDYASSEAIVKISKLSLSGNLSNNSSTEIMPVLMAGFAKNSNNVKLVDAKNAKSYFDSDLSLDIIAKSSLSARDYYRTLPGIASYGVLARWIDYNWDVQVNYSFKNADGIHLESGTFKLEGTDRDKPGLASGYTTLMTGILPLTLTYPDADAQQVVSAALMNAVGEELGKAIHSQKIASYLASREKLRDGMDVKTYVEFTEKKKRLESERAIARAERQKDLEVQIKNTSQLADIKAGSVMVLGIGVSKYQSAQIPTLKYADRDSRRVVQLFKDKYKLSNDRAMLLNNEDATAIKISRFITQSAAKLLSADDTFILYFGGHGAPDVDAASNDSDGLKKYLLLHDTELDSLPMTGLSLNNLATLLEKLPCKRVVILLDSCFSGTAGGQTLAKLKSVRISDKSYKNITDLSGEGRVILAASSENQVSHEEDSLQAGVFTHYLIEGLNGKAKTKDDGSINILSLYEYVNKEVSRYTKNKQSPVFRGTLDANIIF